MRLLLLLAGTVSLMATAQAEPLIVNASPARQATFFVNSWISFERAPTFRRAAPVIRDRLYAALTDALKARGVRVTQDGSSLKEFEINLSARKGHSDLKVDGLKLLVSDSDTVVDSLYFEHVDDFKAWASQTAERLLSSPGIIAAFEKHARARLLKEAAEAPSTQALSSQTAALVNGSGGLVAVFPISGTAEGRKGRERLQEALRTLAGEALEGFGYTVLVPETMLRLLTDRGVDVAKASEAETPFDTARQLKLSLFMTAGLSEGDGGVTCTAKLFDTRSGKELATLQFKGTSLDDLRRQWNAPSGAAPFFVRGLTALGIARLDGMTAPH